MSLWQRWKNRHRHDWIVYGGGRLCKICSTCAEYRCEDGSLGWDEDVAAYFTRRRQELITASADAERLEGPGK